MRSSRPQAPPDRDGPGRRAVDRLRQRDTGRLRTAFVAAPTGIALLDAQGAIVDANPALCALLDRGRADLLHRELIELVHPADAAAVAGLLAEAPDRPRAARRLEVRCVRAGADIRWAELATSHVSIDDDPWIVVHILDIEARHRSEARVRRSEARNAALVDELHRRNAQLHDVNRRLHRFASLASHDLSAPLAAIGSVLALIERDGRLEGDQAALLTAGRERAGAMRELIASMLEYARSGGALQRERVDLQVLAAEALDGLAEQVRDRDARVRVDELPGVLADRGQLLRVLRNLFDNAIKFVAPGTRPEVAVSARRLEAGWEVAVTDNGPGVPESDRERIFEMFERDHAPGVRGSGFGLAICADIVARHGGSISAQRSSAGGSRFAFTLPDVGERCDEAGGARAQRRRPGAR